MADVFEVLAATVRRDWPKSENVFRLGPLTLRQVSFRIFGAELEPPLEGKRVLRLTLDAPDSRDGEPLRITFSATILDAPDDVLAGKLRDALHSLIMHEVDEWIEVSGERAFDPHKPELVG